MTSSLPASKEPESDKMRSEKLLNVLVCIPVAAIELEADFETSI